MKILFAMSSPEYLRFYDDTVRELARRGHEVLLAASMVRQGKPVRFDVLDGARGGRARDHGLRALSRSGPRRRDAAARAGEAAGAAVGPAVPRPHRVARAPDGASGDARAAGRRAADSSGAAAARVPRSPQTRSGARVAARRAGVRSG